MTIQTSPPAKRNNSVRCILLLLFYFSSTTSFTPIISNRIPPRTVLRSFSSYETFGDGALSDVTFDELYSDKLPKWLTNRAKECGWIYPTLIQERALDVLLDGSDCILQSQTGSGKTLAYLLPLLASINPKRSAVQALVIVPTRELGIQVSRVAKRLAASSGIVVMNVLQGSNNKRQKKWVKADPPHVVIGTPSELSSMIIKSSMKYNAVKFVVVDEVDACLLSNTSGSKTSYSTVLNQLLSHHLSPTYTSIDIDDHSIGNEIFTYNSKQYDMNRQTVFVSATIPQHNHFVSKCIQNQWISSGKIEHVRASPGELLPPTLRHQYVVCESINDKMMALQQFLQRFSGGARLLIFCHENRPLEQMAQQIESRNKKVVTSVLQYEDSTSTRMEAMETFRGPNGGYLGGRILDSDTIEAEQTKDDGVVRILFATDLAARGLDVQDVSHVINLDLPMNSDTYVHRGGRAGRLGKKGIVLSILTTKEEFVLKQKYANELTLDLKCIARQKKKEKLNK